MRRTDIIEQAKAIRAATQEMGRTTTDEAALSCPALFDEWKSGAAYETGDIRKRNGNLYRCLQNHTSQDDWTPEAAVSLWVEIADPSIEWPDWVQPAGAHDAYAQGAKVTHNEKHWTSDVDNNVWEPGVYGWTEAAQ